MGVSSALPGMLAPLIRLLLNGEEMHPEGSAVLGARVCPASLLGSHVRTRSLLSYLFPHHHPSLKRDQFDQSLPVECGETDTRVRN